MTRKTARLTDTDWVLLKALWDRPAQTMGNIVQQVQADNPDITWSYKTYFTYLNNLCDKGFAAYDIRNAKADRLYRALISRQEAMQMESDSLLSRVSGASLKDLLTTMAGSGRLSRRDQQELLELVNKLEQDEQKRGD